MAESTFSLVIDKIKDRVCHYLGYGPDYTGSGVTLAQQGVVCDCVQSGLRRFLYPPPVNGRVWSWRFLKPVTTITLWESIAITSGITVGTADDNGTATVTASAAAFYPSMISKNIVITGIGTYPIASYTSSTVVVVTGNPGTQSTKTFSITATGDYDLPDDFGSIVGHLTFGADTGCPPVMVCGEGQIRAMRQRDVDYTGRTQYVAVRPKALGQTGQRFELITWPIPDADYTLSYQYNAFPDKHGDIADTEYPLGGMAHTETILESCLAVAEQRYDDAESTNHQEEFMRRLAASIDIDQKAGPQWLGYGADGSDEADREPLARTTRVSYNDVYY